MIDQVAFERIRKRIDNYREAMIQMQLGLTAIPALSPDNGGLGEFEKAQFLLSNLRSLGFAHIQEFNAPDERVPSGIRPNIIAKIPGKNHH